MNHLSASSVIKMVLMKHHRPRATTRMVGTVAPMSDVAKSASVGIQKRRYNIAAVPVCRPRLSFLCPCSCSWGVCSGPDYGNARQRSGNGVTGKKRSHGGARTVLSRQTRKQMPQNGHRPKSVASPIKKASRCGVPSCVRLAWANERFALPEGRKESGDGYEHRWKEER